MPHARPGCLPKRPFRAFFLPALVAAALSGAAAADVLVLDDGRRVEGTIVEETAKEVKIKTSFGTLTYAKDTIVTIERGKTRDDAYAEKLAACKTAGDYYQLGLWCEENTLKRRAEEIYKKAIELDPDHEGARAKLGFVRHKGEWMTPAERDARIAAETAAEMKAKGLVEHQGRWVTPEDKARLERGLVLHDGTWMTKDEALARQGLAEVDGEVMPAWRGQALLAARGFADAAKARVDHDLGTQAIVIGVMPLADMKKINGGLEIARAWFDKSWKSEPGLGLFGGRLAEFYVFSDEADLEFAQSAAWVKGRSSHIPDGWEEAVKRLAGFTWLDPIPISSARQANRGPDDLAGHCYHHMGHLMVGRLGYDGRLLPPWYEEGVASLTEMRVHGTNYVFCRSSIEPTAEGTQSTGKRKDADDGGMRSAEWRIVLRRALESAEAREFDKLAHLDFAHLQLIDIAQSMAIVEWLESKGGGALAKFHAELRAGAPPAPERVIRARPARQSLYDRAFMAAAGVDYRRADQEWRKWFLSL